MAILVGQQLGGYQLLQLLGHRFFGDVYLAKPTNCATRCNQ